MKKTLLFFTVVAMTPFALHADACAVAKAAVAKACAAPAKSPDQDIINLPKNCVFTGIEKRSDNGNTGNATIGYHNLKGSAMATCCFKGAQPQDFTPSITGKKICQGGEVRNFHFSVIQGTNRRDSEVIDFKKYSHVCEWTPKTNKDLNDGTLYPTYVGSTPSVGIFCVA